MSNLNFPHDFNYIKNLVTSTELFSVQRKDHVFSLGIGLSSRCNFRCPMCYYHTDLGNMSKAVDMPLKLLSSIIEHMPILANVIIGLEGEPFCYPHIFQALDIIATKADTISLVSNASLLTKSVCDSLKPYPISLFALSIDADNDVLYEKFRLGGKLDIFKKHGAYLAQCLGDVVRLHTVIFTENIEGVAMMPKFATEMGIKSISFQQFRPHKAAVQRGISAPSSPNLMSCLEKIINNALKFGVTIYFDGFFGENSIMQQLFAIAEKNPLIKVQQYTENQCPYLTNFTSILSDGRLFPCCGDFRPATISEYSFDGIFNHSYLQKLRLMYKKKIRPAPCYICRHLTK